MAQINRANAAVNLNLPGAWVGGVAPTSIDIATWGTPNIITGPSQALGGAVSWQGILLQPTQTTNIIIGTTSAAITIGASGIDLSASGANLNINSPVTVVLGASQTWSVAAGKTLTGSIAPNAISGDNKDVTFSGGGTTSLGGTNTSSWTNSQLTVASGLVITADNRALGAATNNVVVQSGGALRINATQTFSPTSFVVAGQGASGLQAGSIYIVDSSRFTSGKTIELQGASPTIGVNAGGAGSHAGGITGNPTGDVTFNVVGTNIQNPTFTGTQSTFEVQSGNRVVLQGVNPVGAGAETAADFCIQTTDVAGLGNTANPVTVKNSIRLTSGTNTNPVLSRNYFFEGEASPSAPSAPKVVSIAPVASTGTVMTFEGIVTGTADNWVKSSTSGGSGIHRLAFTGSLQGSWNLRSFSSVQTVYLDPALDISAWTGDLWAHRVSYGKAPTGAATYENGATIDNISGAALTLLHSGYTLAGDLTFTGSSNMSLGSGDVETASAPDFTVSANTLTIPGTITGLGGFLKAGIGGLTLGGATSGYTSYSHTGGTLTLNNSNALGTSTATFIITAAVANTLDSTTGATLLNTGATNLQGNFTWGGLADLTLGSGAVTLNAARTITFVAGKTGTLKAPGAITTASNLALTIGGLPVGGSRSRFWLVGANALTSGTHSVTAGYFRISNSLGLGGVGTTATWTVSSGAALELADGITPTSNKTAAILGTGPNIDGALRSVNGSNTFAGPISISSAAVTTRFQVDAGTFTLSGAQIAPAAPNTPLAFTALGASAVLDQQRQFGANVGNVSTNNGGAGTVVLSTSNLHTGALTCETGGTTRVTQANATGSGAGNDVFVVAGATLESTVQSIFSAKLSLGTNGSAARAILKFAA
jgi:fibronectin-binding autotransporter adhesin